MSSDVFILSSVQDPGAPTAIRQAVELAGVSLSRVHDAAFGLDGTSAPPDLDSVVRAAGLDCPSVGVSSSLRAVIFEAASILSDDADLVVVCSLQPETCTAFVLASPEAVGRRNLMPSARLAARSLAGPEPALHAEGLTSADVEICKDGDQAAALLHELLDELETKSARWGMVTVGDAVLLVERV
jgi:hypothetical protein